MTISKPDYGICPMCKVEVAVMPSGKPWRHREFKNRRKPWCEGRWHAALPLGGA